MSIPVLVTGASRRHRIRKAITDGDCDAVTIARPLIANPDLPRLFGEGHDRPERPCTYSNKCLFSLLEAPLGCHDERRFGSHEEMGRELYAVFDPPGAESAAGRVQAAYPAPLPLGGNDATLRGGDASVALRGGRRTELPGALGH